MNQFIDIDDVLDIDALENSRQEKLVRIVLAVCLISSFVVLPLDIYIYGFNLWKHLLSLPFVLFIILGFYFLNINDYKRLNIVLISIALFWMVAPAWRLWNSTSTVGLFIFFGPMIFAGLLLSKRWVTIISLIVIVICVSIYSQFPPTTETNLAFGIQVIRLIFLFYIITIWTISIYIQNGIAKTRSQIKSQTNLLKHSLKSTQLSQNKFATLIENAPEAILLFDKETFSIQLANEKACSLIGRTEEQIVAGGTQLIMPPNINADLYRHLLQSSNTKITDSTIVKPVKFNAVVAHKNGDTISCEVEMVKFDAMQGSLFRVSLFDTRDKQKKEQKIKQQASIIQEINDAVYTTNEHSIINSWNQAAVYLYGWSETEAIGQNARDLLTKNAHDEDVNNRIKSALEKGYWQGDIQHYHKDGHLLDLGVSFKTLRKNNKKKY